jgi:hypothetical protein
MQELTGRFGSYHNPRTCLFEAIREYHAAVHTKFSQRAQSHKAVANSDPFYEDLLEELHWLIYGVKTHIRGDHENPFEDLIRNIHHALQSQLVIKPPEFISTNVRKHYEMMCMEREKTLDLSNASGSPNDDLR